MNSGPGAREIVRKSYDFALNQVGQEKDSGDLWVDYIQFLRAAEASTYSKVPMRKLTSSFVCTADFNVGGTAEDGCLAQGLSSRGADTH